MQVDGALVALGEDAAGADRADRLRALAGGPVEFDGVAGARLAQVHVAVRKAPGGEPLAAGLAAQQPPGLFEAAQVLRGARLGQPRLAGAQRQLVGGAGQVGGGDVGVVGVDDRVLDVAFEEHPRMRHQVLVEGVGLRHQHHRAGLRAADAAGPLPGGHLAARVSDQQTHVESAHVDAQLEGGGRDHAHQLAGEQAALDLAALLGQEAGPIRRDAPAQGGLRLDHPLVDQLGDAPRLGEGDRAQAEAGGEAEQASRRGVGRAGRVQQQHVARRARRAVGLDHVEAAARQRAGQLAGVRDGGRRRHDPGPRAVVRRHPQQPPQHLRHVGAEDAAVGVQLVDHDPAQGREQLPPARVPRQDADVQHVGGRDQHARRTLADPLAAAGGGVAVVDLDEVVAVEAEGSGVGAQAVALIAGQRLQREEVERPGLLAGLRRPQHGELVDERLAAGGGRGEHDVGARVEPLEGPNLVLVEGADAAAGEGGGEARVARRPGVAPPGRLRGQDLVMAEGVPQSLFAAEGVEEAREPLGGAAGRRRGGGVPAHEALPVRAGRSAAGGCGTGLAVVGRGRPLHATGLA